MTKSEYRRRIGALRGKYQKKINDLYIWSCLAVDSLDLSLGDTEFLASRNYAVPSSKTVKTVRRSEEQVTRLIKQARDRDLYECVFSYFVAQGEAFLQDVLHCTLIYDETKLKTRIPGVNHVKSIDVAEIIDRRTRKALIESLIEKELTSLFYAKPSSQFAYLSEVAEVSITDDFINTWIEMKATRDLIVHNASVISKVYLAKAGSKARGENGSIIPIDKRYLEKSMATLKSMIGNICTPIQQKSKKHG